MIIKTKLLPPGSCAFTVFPFVFVHPDVYNSPSVLKHEAVHYEQQRRWAIYGLGVGLLVWFLLYMLALPIGWNWWRARWEREAYRAEGVPNKMIDKILKLPPYYLWWM